MLPNGWVLREPRDELERGLPATTMGDLRDLIADGEQPAVGTRFLLTIVHGEDGEQQKIVEYVGAPDLPELAAVTEPPPLAAVPDPEREGEARDDDGPRMSDMEAYVKAHHLSQALGLVASNIFWLGIMVGAARTSEDYRIVLRDARDVIDGAEQLYRDVAAYTEAKFGQPLAPVPDPPDDPLLFSGFTITPSDTLYNVSIDVRGRALEFSVPRPKFPDEPTQQAYENMVALTASAVNDRVTNGEDPVEVAKEEQTAFIARAREWHDSLEPVS